MSPRRGNDFSKATARALGERVNLLCSNPDCRALTKARHTNAEKAVSVGKACHIYAAAAGGPRYDPNQKPEERRSIQNGIWLCSNCATLIDTDEVRWPPDLLCKWKTSAEDDASHGIGRPGGKTKELAGVVARVAAIPRGTVARLVYQKPESSCVNDKFPIEIMGVDPTANVLRFRELVRNNSPPDAMPLGDIEDAWQRDDQHHLRVSGYMEHTPLAPYRYKSRGR